WIKPTNATSDISATAWGDDTIIVACANAHSPTTDGQYCVFLGVYNTTDITTTGTSPQTWIWPARWQTYLTAAQLQAGVLAINPGAPPVVTSVGFRVSIDWFTSVPPTSDPSGSAPTLEYYLAVFLNPSTNDTGSNWTYYFFAPLDQTGAPQMGSTLYSAFGIPGRTGWESVSCFRDPGGRLGKYDQAPAGTIQALLFDTYATVGLQENNGYWLLPWIGYDIDAPSSSDRPPTIAYFMDLSAA